MKGIITVLGKDRVGIIAKVCTYLAEHQVNILDISGATQPFENIVEELQQVGEAIGVEIKLQHEDIFNIMHRI